MSEKAVDAEEDKVETLFDKLVPVHWLVRRLRQAAHDPDYDPQALPRVEAQLERRLLWLLNAELLRNEHFAMLMRREVDVLQRELAIVAARRSMAELERKASDGEGER